MREIKFRAYDRKAKAMFPVHNLAFNKISNELTFISGVDINHKDSDFSGDVAYGGTASKKTGTPPIDRFVLMQYTGLSDRKGVEIYEGDIVKNHRNDFADEIILCRWQEPVDDGHWTLEKPGFKFERINGAGTTIWVAHKHFEVIGNIYETPELLLEIK